MAPVTEPRPDTRRPSGPEPLRRKRPLPAPTSAIRRRSLRILLVFVTLVLIVDALVGEKGLLATMRVRRQYRETASQLAKVRWENAQLREGARRLKEDPGAIEALAREQLGLIGEGEILFIIKDWKTVGDGKTVR